MLNLPYFDDVNQLGLQQHIHLTKQSKAFLFNVTKFSKQLKITRREEGCNDNRENEKNFDKTCHFK